MAISPFGMLTCVLIIAGCASSPARPQHPSPAPPFPGTVPSSLTQGDPQTDSKNEPAAEAKQYRVDMVVTGEGRSATITRFLDDGRQRMDIAAEGHTMRLIERPDKNVLYMVMPDEKMYLERPLEHRAPGKETDLTIEKVGTESVKGQVCDKFKLSNSNGVAFFWANQQTQLPVRLQDDKSTIDWENYQIGAQPAALFDPPSGISKFEMPNMGMMLGQNLAGMALGGLGGQMAQQFGGNLGTTIGLAAGGPMGMMLGRMVGQSIGGMLSGAAQRALVPKSVSLSR
ncbi:MAG: DUF4412 domain-containing protein [Nitrospirae bacterium]|nr:DUF4412 domain-containing protein [Nitrospirota bacterium]